MARPHFVVALSLFAVWASGCGGDQRERPPQPQPAAEAMSASDLDALCAKARCQRVVMTDAVTVGLHGGDQTRVLTVTARPEAGDGYRIQLTLEVLEGGIPVTIGGPWSVPDGSAASVSVPWGGGVRVAAKRVDGAQVRLLITEEGASPPS